MERGARQLPAWSLAAALAALYLLLDPPSADLAAQTYRTWLFEQAGWVVWDNGWYAGHHVPAYSILFPPLAGLLGPRVVGALAAVAAAWCVDRLLAGRGAGARAAAWWFAGATAISLVTGRLTFALGLAVGCAAVLALARGRHALAVLLALATPLASPVAGAFLALVVVAHAAGMQLRGRTLSLQAAAMVAAAVLPAAALGVLFPEGGTFPFAADAFWPSLTATLVLLAVLPRAQRTLRIGTALYALVLVASAVLDTPMGGNAVRLGAILAGPVAAYALWPHRRRVLLALAPFLLYWQVQTPADDWLRASGDPSIEASYYTGVIGFLEREQRRLGGPVRIEVPFTDNHWESVHLAQEVPLARGWMRQLDREVNALFYEDGLTPDAYERWLRDTGVAYVALADAPIDPSAADEAALVRAGQPFLREVWRDEHWRVFAVRDAGGLAEGGRVTRLGPDEVAFDGGRRVLLRVRWTPYWRLAGAEGCVRKAGAWTAVERPAAGPARLVAAFDAGRIGASSARC